MSASIQLADEETGEIPEPIVCAVNPNESMFLVVFHQEPALILALDLKIFQIYRKFQEYAELM
mgnify:CR=1 FL=1